MKVDKNKEDEIKHLLMQIQQYQQQAQVMALQRQQLEIQSLEMESAEDALKDSAGDVFRAVGPILVKSKKDDVQKYLKDSKEKIGLRLKTIEAQEKRLGDRIKALGEKLKPHLQGLSG